MKLVSRASLLLLALGAFFSGFSQQTSRPNLFDAFVSKITCTSSELDKIFTTPAGNTLQLAFANNFKFQGTISSSEQKYPNLKTVIIKSSSLPGLIFGISKRTNADNSFSYVGRILNENFADGFELKADQSGSYSLNKIKTDDVIQDRQ